MFGRILLVVSIAGNAAFAYLLWQRANGHDKGAEGKAPVVREARKADAPTPQRVLKPWPQLLAISDEAEYVSRLRAEGLPHWAVKALVRLRVTEKYQARLKEIQATSNSRPYWRTRSFGGISSDPKAQAERRRIYSEINAEILALVGRDPDGEPISPHRRRNYGNLPPEKLASLERIEADYAEMSAALRGGDAVLESGWLLLPEERQKLKFLEAEKRADLAQLLTPAELEDFDRRSSPSAGQLRMKLRNLDATEEEYLRLYPLQKAHDDQFGSSQYATSEERARQRKAQAQLNEQFKEALGEERFAEYTAANHMNFDKTRGVVERLKLPKTAATILIAQESAATAAAYKISSDRSLTKEARAQQLAELEQRTVAELSATLGENGLGVYRQQAGEWMRRLAPQPANPAPAQAGGGR